jgi:hypothetical protein
MVYNKTNSENPYLYLKVFNFKICTFYYKIALSPPEGTRGHQRAPEGTRGITNFEVENFEVKGRVKGAITDHGSLEGRGGLLSVFRVLAADEGGPRFFFFYDRSFFMASAFFQAVLLDDDREVRRHSFSAFLVVDSADLQLSFPQGTGNNA